MAGYRTIAATVSTAVFMQFLDATALNTALPAMARDLHVVPVDLNVAILAYQLSLAAFIPLGGIAADRLGGRNALAAALGVFLAGSLLCALSPSLPALIAARAFQGLGGAVMMPVSRQLVVRSAAKHELVSAMNWLLIPGIIGPLLGPVIGGLIVTWLSWHWIFLINLPVGLAGAGLTLALIPNERPDHPARPDIRGIALIATAVFCLIFGLEELARPHGGAEAIALLAAGLLVGALYGRHAAGHPGAALDLTLFEIGSFRHSTIAGTLLRAISGATGFLLPLWFQLAMGMTPAGAGLLIVAGTGGTLASRFLGTPLMRIAHPWRIVVGGVACLTLVLLLLSTLHAGSPRPLISALLFGQGLALYVPLMLISAVAYVDVPTERLGAAAGLYTIVQQLTLSLGVTLGVWAIAAMRWLARSGASDAITYQGSLVLLAIVAGLTIVAAGKLGRASLETLRPPGATDRAPGAPISSRSNRSSSSGSRLSHGPTGSCRDDRAPR